MARMSFLHWNPVSGRTRLLVRRAMYRLRGWTDLTTLREAGMHVGDGVFVGLNAFLDPDFCFLIRIEDRARIAVNVTVLAHDASSRTLVGWTRVAPVVIGRDTFIGA